MATRRNAGGRARVATQTQIRQAGRRGVRLVRDAGSRGRFATGTARDIRMTREFERLGRVPRGQRIQVARSRQQRETASARGH